MLLDLENELQSTAEHFGNHFMCENDLCMSLIHAQSTHLSSVLR